MRHHHSKSEKKEYRKKLLKTISLVLAVVIVASVALLILHIWENQQGNVPVPTPADNTVTFNGQKYREKNVDTMLVLGLDKFDGEIETDSYNNDRQADFLMLFVMDNRASNCTAVQINRDTMVDNAVLGLAGEKVGTAHEQLALAHTYGDGGKESCRNTVDSVLSIIPNKNIHNYISVTMDSVPVFNDLVGGVEVTVLDDFSSLDETLVQGETVTLSGEHALTYVRSRKGMEDATDLNRMERQRQYLGALIKKATHRANNDDSFVVDTLYKLSDYMVSNCSISELEMFFDNISSYDFTEIRSLEGEYSKGENYMEFYPDKEYVEELIIDLFYEPVE